MISDTLHDAIYEIEEYQRIRPGTYDHWADDIDVVKKVMAALMNRFDEFPREYPLDITESLTPEQ